jgi:5-methylcytosine-specific restriction endonuclease McrA
MTSRRKEQGDTRPSAPRRRALRLRLWTVQKGQCPWCLAKLASPQDGELDRIVPGKDGGRYVLDNLVLACCGCNQSHGHAVRWGRATVRTVPANREGVR